MEGTSVFLQVGLGSTWREGGSETARGGAKEGGVDEQVPTVGDHGEPLGNCGPSWARSCAFQFPSTVAGRRLPEVFASLHIQPVCFRSQRKHSGGGEQGSAD